jgi:hypothetical protein
MAGRTSVEKASFRQFPASIKAEPLLALGQTRVHESGFE